MTKLVAHYVLDGDSVKVGEIPQESGLTVNNFSAPITYSVYAKNGQKRDYTVVARTTQWTCEVAYLGIQNSLTEVTFDSSTNPPTVMGTIGAQDDLSKVVLKHSIYGTNLLVDGNSSLSGVTPFDFTSPRTLAIQGSNGCSNSFSMRVTKETLPGDASIVKQYARANLPMVRSATVKTLWTLSKLPVVSNMTVSGVPGARFFKEFDATGEFDDETDSYQFNKGQIALTVPYGTNLRNLNVTFSTTNGARAIIVGGRRVSGNSGSFDFSSLKADVQLEEVDGWFAVPYTLYVIMDPPPPTVAVSKDATFTIMVKSQTQQVKDQANQGLRDVLSSIDRELRTFMKNTLNSPPPYWKSDNYYPPDLSKISSSLVNFNKTAVKFARWTYDPGQIHLNIVGNGFQRYIYDWETYANALGCYDNPFITTTIYNSRLKKWQPWYKVSGPCNYYKRNVYYLETSDYSRALEHQNRIRYGEFRGYRPEYKNFGGLREATDRIDAYGQTLYKGNREHVEHSPTYMVFDFTRRSIRQTDTVFYWKEYTGNVTGQFLKVELPAMNYISSYSPSGGTAGDRVTVNFGFPIPSDTFNVRAVMDGKAVLNPSLNYGTGGITGMTFTVPILSKPSKITVFREPKIRLPGSNFELISYDTFKYRDYTPISGLVYQYARVQYIVGANPPTNNPAVRRGSVHYYRLVSGKVPPGMSFTGSGTITGRATGSLPETTLTIEAVDGVGNSTRTNITVSAAFPPPPPAPSFNYPSLALKLLKGKSMTLSPTGLLPNVPISFQLKESLPIGLSLNKNTGVISGTPSVAQEAKTYRVTALNPGGTRNVDVSIQIFESADDMIEPTINYTTLTYNLTGGQDFSVSPSVFTGSGPLSVGASDLPVGLSIHPNTGIISGVPTSEQEAKDVFVIAKNPAGTAVITLSFKVTGYITTPKPSPPDLVLGYPNAPFILNNGQAANITAFFSGGTLNSCAISPSLPAGLSFNTSNCIISGTPTATQTATDYTITATATEGTLSVTLSIAVISNVTLSYPSASYSWSTGLASSANATVTGGTITGCVISPALPTGLSISNTTCNISGTPSVVHPATNHTVTVTTSAGDTTFLVNISVTTPGSYTIGGTVSGFTHAGTNMTLQLNGANNLTITASGAFTFATSLVTGSPYTVSITQPLGHLCSVSSGIQQYHKCRCQLHSYYCLCEYSHRK